MSALTQEQLEKVWHAVKLFHFVPVLVVLSFCGAQSTLDCVAFLVSALSAVKLCVCANTETTSKSLVVVLPFKGAQSKFAYGAFLVSAFSTVKLCAYASAETT